MSKFWFVVGIFLILFATGFFMLGLLNLEDGPVTQVIAAIACEPHEQMVTETQNWSLPNGEFGQNITYYCEVEPGQRRDVNATVTGILAAGFAIPLTLGIIFIFIGARSFTRAQSAAINEYFEQYPPQSTSTVIDLRNQPNSIPPETQQMLNNMLGGFSTAFTQPANKGTLAERLEQLKEAYENDLISQEEYDKVRQAILDSMDD